MREVETISILGAGIMGSGIAQVMAQAGYSTIISDVEQRYLDHGLNRIRKGLELLRSKGKLSSDQVNLIMERTKGTLDFEEAARCADLIIEAVPESLELKRQVFRNLDKIAADYTILATNTSAISITLIASNTRRADRVIGMHFSNPVPVMMGLEVIPGRSTSDETLKMVLAVCKRIGKEAFIVRDFPGFAGNRLFAPFINEAFYTVWQGIATPEDVDKMCRLNLHHPMGPFELADFTGLDTILSILEYLHKELGEKYRPCPLLKQLVSAGYLGRKTGRGVYVYSNGGR